VPQVDTLEALNALLRQGTRDDERRVISGRAQSIGVAMQLEREYLRPLAQEGFALARMGFPQVNASGCAKVLTNFYSSRRRWAVPCKPRFMRPTSSCGSTAACSLVMNVASGDNRRCST